MEVKVGTTAGEARGMWNAARCWVGGRGAEVGLRGGGGDVEM